MLSSQFRRKKVVWALLLTWGVVNLTAFNALSAAVYTSCEDADTDTQKYCKYVDFCAIPYSEFCLEMEEKYCDGILRFRKQWVADKKYGVCDDPPYSSAHPPCFHCSKYWCALYQYHSTEDLNGYCVDGCEQLYVGARTIACIPPGT
jgi:hypothetical protein